MTDTTTTPRSPLTPALLIPAALLLIACLWSLSGLLVWTRDPTSEGDWKRAAAHVSAQLAGAKGSAAVRVHPVWNERPLVHMSDLPAEALARQYAPVPEDLSPFTTLWLITERGRVDEARAALPFPAEVSVQKTFGEVVVAKVAIPTSLRRPWSARDHLKRATVHRRAKGEKKTAQRCGRWDATREAWFCGGAHRRHFVGAVTRELADDPRACIWMHPLRGKTIVLELGDVPLSRTLRVRGGTTLRGSRLPGQTPLRWRVFVNDREVLKQTEQPWRSRWDAHDLDTSALAGKRGTLRVEVESDRDRERYFCMNAWVMPD